MGGAAFVFTGENDADILHNSALISLNMVEVCYKRNVKKSSILLQYVCILNIIKRIQLI